MATAIPHYLILTLLLGGGTWFTWSIVLIAAVTLAFTRRLPRPLFDLIFGIQRWALRVTGYAALMTDRYPPFRLGLGGNEPSAPPTAEPAAAPVLTTQANS